MKVHLIAAPFDPQTRTFDAAALQHLPDDGHAVTLSSQVFQAAGVTYLALALAYHEKPDGAGRSPRSAAVSWDEKPAGNGGKRSSSPASNGAASGNGPAGEKSAAGGDKTPYSPQRLSAEQLKIFERLRDWRFQRAKGLAIPPYVICSNRELEEIVLQMPRTVEELAALPGMGGAKSAQHGAALAAEINRVASEQLRR
jgi:superfamily II DNA helicase RecQ